jgi:hypothetical protein
MLNLFNRPVMPSWDYSGALTAPVAGAILVTHNVVRKAAYIYGFRISAQEKNDFYINWSTTNGTYSLLVPFGGLGYLSEIDYVPLNEGQPTDPRTIITITVVNAAGAGLIYQAGLLIAEVDN